MNFLPVILIIGVWLFFMRQMQGGGGGRARCPSASRAQAAGRGPDQGHLADVAGCDEAKEEVGELVDFLRDPSKFTKLGGRFRAAC
jgi:cell division protease FtsH